MTARLLIQVILISGLCCCSRVDNKKETYRQDLETTEGRIAPDKFVDAIKKLETIGFYRKRSNCEITLDSGYCCIINPQDNWLIKTIDDINKLSGTDSLFNIEPIRPIRFDDLIEIKSYFVVGNYEVQKNTYPRTNIVEWTFNSINSANRIKNQLDSLSENNWFNISKTPITWWSKDNRIFLILPGGHFVLTEIPKIEKLLREEL